MDSVSSDEVYQDQILPHVSRTFALTIPQLPEGLRSAVTCAYLLCRIADTIEDEPALSPAETLAFLDRFKAVVAGSGGHGDAVQLAGEVERRLSARTLPAERELIANMVRDNAGHDARRFTPLVFSLFMFILLGNLLGMIPYSFTFTSHIVVTFAMAAIVFIGVTLIGIARHG